MADQVTTLDIQCVNPLDSGPHPLTPAKPLKFTHAMLNNGLFDDAALVRLLDHYPAHDIHVTTMALGANPNQTANHWRVGTTEGLSGEEILSAVRKGQLWLNIKRLNDNAPIYQPLFRAIYRELAQQLCCPVPKWQKATLLVSSPTASVYYHADSVPNILWHIRGEKTVFVYPHTDPRFASLEHLELICSGESEEELPYHPDFEPFAAQFVLKPGQALIWPQNSPHRVINTRELNVSLSTEHITPEARRKVNLHRGNRLLRKLGAQPKWNHPASLPGITKQALAVCQSALKKVLRKAPISFELTPTFRVDPDAALGYRDIT